jgi:uncharacterized protein (TIGR02466 family)
MITELFSTPVLRRDSGLSGAQVEELCAYLLDLRASSPGERHSNHGGWHSSGNLLAEPPASFPYLRQAITEVVFAYAGEALQLRGMINFALTAWAVINRRGDFNAPHNHARSVISGALYLRVPADMRGGEFVMLDPRFNLNSYDSPQLRELRLRLPWDANELKVKPAAGEFLLFPSWLVHYVNAFENEDPDALRIAISFNASI